MDGQLVRALEGMADRLRKKEGKQKKLKSLLVYPCILFVFISALLIAFRRFFLPNMEMLMSSRQEATTGFAKLFPLLVTKIPDFMVGVVLLQRLDHHWENRLQKAWNQEKRYGCYFGDNH